MSADASLDLDLGESGAPGPPAVRASESTNVLNVMQPGLRLPVPMGPGGPQPVARPGPVLKFPEFKFSELSRARKVHYHHDESASDRHDAADANSSHCACQCASASLEWPGRPGGPDGPGARASVAYMGHRAAGS
jgi:hypothetical protein